MPAFVDVEPDTFNVDVERIEEMVSPQTRAILVPNLAGNAPDWDRIREIADRHGLAVIEDSCDALGATLRGTPTGTRSDISVTSFALSHIITCAGNGGMVLLDDDVLRDRCLSLRRWGRRSEPQLYGTRHGERNFWEDLDGVRYDNLFIFDDVGLELRTLRARRRVRGQATRQARRTTTNAANAASRAYCALLGRYPTLFVSPRQTAGPRDRVALVRVPDPSRRGVRSGRPPGVPRRRAASTRARSGPATRCASR